MWELILSVIIKIAIFVLEKLGADKKTKDLFFAFVEQAANDTKSVRLMEIYREQKAWLDSHPWPETNVKGKDGSKG